MSVGGWLSRAGRGDAYPDATGQMVVFLHGPCESEECQPVRDPLTRTRPQVAMPRTRTTGASGSGA